MKHVEARSSWILTYTRDGFLNTGSQGLWTKIVKATIFCWFCGPTITDLRLWGEREWVRVGFVLLCVCLLACIWAFVFEINNPWEEIVISYMTAIKGIKNLLSTAYPVSCWSASTLVTANDNNSPSSPTHPTSKKQISTTKTWGVVAMIICRCHLLS